MIFFLSGTRGGKFGARLEQRLEKVFYLCVSELKLDKFNGIVHIEMPRKKGLLEGTYHGFCELEDKVALDKGKYWWVGIKLANTHSFHDVVETLCHEMVHVKQFLRRELSPSLSSWKGSPIYCSDSPFEEPHEKEAYELEKVLYQKCVDLKLV